MGQSMPYDDIGWYIRLCKKHGGRVLELGCGSGRILVPLLAAGIDVSGVDRSLPMLQQLRREARVAGLNAPIAQMDLSALALCGRFDIVLAPYSLVTYLITPQALEAFLTRVHALLKRDGRLVLDTFVPQEIASFADFRRDYRRPHNNGTLDRHKRIHANADGSNRIERRYRLYNLAGALLDEIHTIEIIRPYHPYQLAEIAKVKNYTVENLIWDYGARYSAAGARFGTLVLRRTI